MQGNVLISHSYMRILFLDFAHHASKGILYSIDFAQHARKHTDFAQYERKYIDFAHHAREKSYLLKFLLIANLFYNFFLFSHLH